MNASLEVQQRRLSSTQIADFYHDLFVEDQVDAFHHVLAERLPPGSSVVDIGGGCGFFASAVQATAPLQVRVLDSDPASVAECRARGIEADVGDALKPELRGNESVVCFNLILHHLVGGSESSTRSIQSQALTAWHHRARWLFVNEYIYESHLNKRLAGRLIWAITSSPLLSAVGKLVSRWVPSLRANTFGVGVRFRAVDEWKALFRQAGYEVVAHVTGIEEGISFPRRLMLIATGRRDSFLLAPAGAEHGLEATSLHQIRAHKRSA